jgi:hypothetical protein
MASFHVQCPVTQQMTDVEIPQPGIDPAEYGDQVGPGEAYRCPECDRVHLVKDTEIPRS